jgi:colicin import membrane protein
VAERTSDHGPQPKYCDDASHNPLNAHRERRKREADATGQRAEETGGQPVTIGLTRAAELVRKLEQLTTQHADTLTRAITELRSAADPESAEAEVYAARTSADQRIAAAEARLAEEINRRREAETERDQAHADRDQADDATAQAITRMEELQHELTTLHHTTTEQLSQLRAETTAELDHARATAQRGIG